MSVARARHLLIQVHIELRDPGAVVDIYEHNRPKGW